MPVTKEDICKVIEEAGITDKYVCIHSSLKSFGHVQGGANAIISAFLEKGCTLLAPSFTYDFQIPPLEDIEQNARMDEDEFEPSGRIYTSDINDIVSDMGAIPRAMLNTAGRHRGIHPTNSFVALGPGAKGLAGCQTPENVYAPFQMMMDKRGYIVMMGVDLTKMTAIHYSEQLSGRELFVRWALDLSGEPVRMREGGCSEGFNNLSASVAGLEKQIVAGNSLWRIFPIYETVRTCADAIKQDAGITHCIDNNCNYCSAMQKGGPILD